MTQATIDLVKTSGKMTGEQMRQIRTDLKLTQKEFADVLGYGKGGYVKISEMENNKRGISGMLIELLYYFYKVVEQIK